MAMRGASYEDFEGSHGGMRYHFDSGGERVSDPEAARTDEERIAELEKQAKAIETRIEELQEEAEIERKKLQNLGELRAPFEDEEGLPERDIARRTQGELQRAMSGLNEVNARTSDEWNRLRDIRQELEHAESLHAMIREDLLRLTPERKDIRQISPEEKRE